MNIYFDGTLINNDYVTGIEFEGKSFNANDIFSLGSTICNNMRLTVSKDLLIKAEHDIEIDNVGIFNVDNIQENDYSYTYTLLDNMVNFNFRYDAEPLIEGSSHIEGDGTKYVTLLELLDDICLQAGTELKTRTFLGYQKHISYYDNTLTAREYISMAAELNSGYAINYNGLYLKQYTNTPTKTILFENCEKYKIGEKHTITRVMMDNGIFEPVGTEEGTTIYLNTNNVFITEQQDLINIYNVINGFEFYSIEATTNDIEVSADTIGQCIAFSNGTNTYKAYKQISSKYHGGWYGTYTFTIGSIKHEETTGINGNEENYKKLQIQIDRNKNQINYEISRTDTIATNIDENTGDVRRVTTTTGFTFNENGLNIYKNDTTYNTLIDNTGTYYKDGETILSQTTKDGTKTKDLDVFGHFKYCEDSIADTPLFIAVKYMDGNNEEGYGHFYNG